MNFDRISLDIEFGGISEQKPLKKGPVHFKGSSGGDSFDAAYNARMASIAEQQQQMAQEYFNFWQTDYQPMEQEKIAANRELIPSETALTKANIEAQQELLPGQTALTKAENEAALSLLPSQTDFAKVSLADETTAIKEKAPVRNAFYKASLEGVDVEGRANKAAADVAQSFAGSNAAMARNTARMGVNPNSVRFAAMGTSKAMDRAKAIGGAKTKARTGAEQENYARLTNAMGY
jgi:hypothetical protein